MAGNMLWLKLVSLIFVIFEQSDTPELFWSEASLLPLYEAIRDYLEIGPRVQVLNDRLSISGDLVSDDFLSSCFLRTEDQCFGSLSFSA